MITKEFQQQLKVKKIVDKATSIAELGRKNISFNDFKNYVKLRKEFK